MLFPETAGSLPGKHGDDYGKWFHRYRREACGAEEDEDFHGLRHTVATLLSRAGVSVVHAEEFVGHEDTERRSEFARYNKGQTLELLKGVADKLVLPINIDALLAAVERSERIDRSSVWPDLGEVGRLAATKKEERRKESVKKPFGEGELELPPGSRPSAYETPPSDA